MQLLPFSFRSIDAIACFLGVLLSEQGLSRRCFGAAVVTLLRPLSLLVWLPSSIWSTGCFTPSIAVVVFVAVATRIAPSSFGSAGYLFHPRCSSPSIAVVVVVVVATRIAPSSFGSAGYQSRRGYYVACYQHHTPSHIKPELDHIDDKNGSFKICPVQRLMRQSIVILVR
jgi:hypothetical protein